MIDQTRAQPKLPPTAERLAAKHNADSQLRRAGATGATQERFAEQSRRPLAQHLADYRDHREAHNKSKKHIALTIQRIEAILSAARVETICGLTGADVMQAIDAISLDPRARNAYLRSIKSFTRWLRIEKRSPRDPLKGLRASIDKSDQPKMLLTAAEAARALSISPRKLWSLTASGDVPSLHLGALVRYPVVALAEWISDRTAAAIRSD